MNKRIAKKIKARDGIKSWSKYRVHQILKAVRSYISDNDIGYNIALITHSKNDGDKNKRICKVQVLKDCVPLSIDNPNKFNVVTEDFCTNLDYIPPVQFDPNSSIDQYCKCWADGTMINGNK